jgi:hypothetical protein
VDKKELFPDDFDLKIVSIFFINIGNQLRKLVILRTKIVGLVYSRSSLAYLMQGSLTSGTSVSEYRLTNILVAVQFRRL